MVETGEQSDETRVADEDTDVSHVERLLDTSLPEDADERDRDGQLLNLFATLEAIFESYLEDETRSYYYDVDDLLVKIHDVRKRLAFEADTVSMDEVRDLCQEVREMMQDAEDAMEEDFGGLSVVEEDAGSRFTVKDDDAN